MDIYTGVCINVSHLSRRMTGVERYMYEIVNRLDGELANRGLRLDLVFPEGLELHLPPLKNAIVQPIKSKGHRIDYLALKRYLEDFLLIDCNLSSGFPIKRGSCICIHDIRPLARPEFDSLGFRLTTRRNVLLTKYIASNTVTDSAFSKHELVSKAGFNPSKIHVINAGWEHVNSLEMDESVFERYPNLSEGGYFYTLGSLAPHKNLIWVVEVARRNPKMMFVVAGKLWRDEMPFNLPQNVKYLGYVSDRENKALLKRCRAYLHPSKYEGFGLPPLEALACGAKAIVSNAGSLPEVFSACCPMFDPDDFEVDLDALSSTPIDDNARSCLLDCYTWDAAARKWADLLSGLCNQGYPGFNVHDSSKSIA